MKVSTYWKAICAAVIAGAGSLGTAMEDGTLTGAEGIAAACVALGALGIVWRVPNREPKDPA
ncbi:hypothetical protein [Streptomyces sp. G1]|uniref:hypothetical protein n=1 Tax=Streptomyces sp. G1 TaxID=361572 RepID=UPI00203073A7|nr:hypothetical protein [Streptomyces sp. G1]MCM1972345.1 hypothetical protein [Streptomyces sp. G1]